jgi:PKD repeat protein
MSTPVIRYPLDLTGRSPDNLITSEPHAISTNGNRAFVPRYGPFYAKSLRVYRQSTGQLLTRGTHYKPAQLFVDASLKVGQEINSLIIITDASIGNDFFIDYQVLGGDYSTSVFAIQQMLNSLSLDNRPIDYGELIGTPEQFPPAPHLHDVGDTYGWEYVVSQLEAVRRAILYGDEQSHAAIYQYVDHGIGQIDARVDSMQLSLTNHIQNLNNPHNTNKTHVGLGNVENYLVASQLEAEAGVRNDRYMTPLRTAQLVQDRTSTLWNHLLNFQNPHGTTKTQVGLGNVDNYATATQQQAAAGTRNDLFVTPVGLQYALETVVSGGLNSHISNYSNPHNTTKAQVGLGNVDNFLTATVEQAVAGISNSLFVTPEGMKSAIQNGASAALNAHLTNYSNPHNTTKAQVGLGSVENFGVTTNPEAEAGVRTDQYMTPAATKAAVTAQAVNPLTAHVNNTVNPHATTKAQVGLANVDNYPTATELEARTGTASDRFMTPIRTRQAIDQFAHAKPETTLDHWGFWRDPQTGYTHCWGRTPPMAPGQYFYCHFRRWFTHVFSITEGGWGRNIDTILPSGLPNALVEVVARPVQRTISNRGFAVAAYRTTGTNSDYVVYNWHAVGISNASGLGGPDAGQFIASIPWTDNGSTDGYSSGGVSNYIDIGLFGGGNQTPVADYTYSGSALTRNFVSTSTDPDGSIVSYAWNFGDGATSNIANPSRTYGAYGNYQVSLTVIDNGGAGSVKTTTVVVDDPNGGGGGCVATTMFIDQTRLAGDLNIDDWVQDADVVTNVLISRQVRQNRIMPQPCYLMTTISGIQLIASDSTPVDLIDGSSKYFHQMQNELVYVDDDDSLRWEAVQSIEYVGIMDVILLNVDDYSYLAGVVGNRRIRTHNNQKT